MSGRRGGRLGPAVAAGCTALVVLVALLVYLDRGSVERANRLFRQGEPERAIEIYRSNVQRDDSLVLRVYNLGTAGIVQPLASGSDRSPADSVLDPVAALRSAAEIAALDGDSVVAARSRYNLGVHFLSRADRSLPPDSLAAILTASIREGRSALRLDPQSPDARWNLALAQRALDSLAPAAALLEGEIDPREGVPDDITFDDGGLTRVESGDGEPAPTPDDPTDPENPQEAEGDQRLAVEGAREAWADQDPGPLSRTEAFRILGEVTDEAETLIRGILWSQRPALPYWESPTLPGGNW